MEGVTGEGVTHKQKPNAWVMWERFPKFVLAFLVASLITTFLAGIYHWNPEGLALVAPVKATNAIRTYLFVLAFVCFGMNTKFQDLRSFGWKPVLAFTIVVLVNLGTGFLMANLMFHGFQV